MDATQSASSQSIRQQLGQFFFRKEIPFGMAAVRIAISFLMLIVMGRSWRFVRELYSADGAPAPLADNYGYYHFLPTLPATWAVALYSLMLLLMFTLMIGWKTRISAIGVFFLFTYFTLQDSLSTMTKYSAISSHVFLLLSLSACGEVWSVDRYLKLKRLGIARPFSLLSRSAKFEIWPQRLLQLFIGIVYLGAAVTKMHTAPYFTGEQLRFWLLTNVNHANPVGEAMSVFPAIFVVFAYIAIIWEILFLFLVWNRVGRWVMLGLGIIFHALTTITLGLFVFPFVCFSVYLAYLTTEDVIWWRERFAKLARRFHFSGAMFRTWRLVSSVITDSALKLGPQGFAAVLLVLVCCAIVLERSMDVYGERSPDGPYELQAMDDAVWQKMRVNDTVIREEDKLLSMDIGEFAIAGLVTDVRKSFKQGTQLYIQANLVPPHGDMYLECNLYDSNGICLQQTGRIVTRDQARYTFSYYLSDSLVPGKYQFVLRSNATEIARKTITVLPGKQESKTVALGD